MKRLYVIAMELEADDIIFNKNMKQISSNYYSNEEEGLLVTGVGKQRTAIELTKLLELVGENGRPEKIINIGYAGSTDIEVGTFVNVVNSYNYEWEIPGEEKYNIMDLDLPVFKKSNVLRNVDCYSAECFVTHTDIKDSVVFDMELHSIYLLCQMYHIQLQSIKLISDNLNLDSYYNNIAREKLGKLVDAIQYVE